MPAEKVAAGQTAVAGLRCRRADGSAQLVTSRCSDAQVDDGPGDEPRTSR
ncbi:hypothetical protein [Streptomyces sp. NRRL S-1896]|nr:hypothetical protein [Streptomyces sp. NRRL S-1896]